jgi:cytochrome b subunit of formate dehydrogenase
MPVWVVAAAWLVLSGADNPPAPECISCHADQSAVVTKSVHGELLGAESCQSCHGSPHDENASKTAPKPGDGCANCHEDQVKDYHASVHGAALARGDGSAATCQSCHGPAHGIVPSASGASPVSPLKVADTCATCHANPDFLAKHRIPFARPVEAYKLSVHGRALASGNEKAATCSSCHGSHGILKASDARAHMNHWNVPDTCGTCHAEVKQTYAHSVHGTAVAAGVTGAPVCTDCHGEHDILAPSERGSLVNPLRVSAVTCGRCHGDERLAARYNLPLDRLPAFEDSFHGLALRSGSQTVANCASCHGVHDILPSSDPRSTVHVKNLPRTCGACHPGAGTRFTIASVHVVAATPSEHAAVKGIRWFYWLMIPFALFVMAAHNGLDWWRKLRIGAPRPSAEPQVPRMNLHFRVAHGLTMVSFLVLVVSGFALKFPGAWWAYWLLKWEGSVALRGLVHRVAAIVLLGGLAYHAGHLIASRRDRCVLTHLVPRWRDLKDAWQMVRHNLGGRVPRPTFGVFSYYEKVEYWAYLWGTIVMAVSGFVLWFNNVSLAWLPKWASDAATALHYYEAILATAAIAIWHLYGVIFDPDVYPMDTAWLTGQTSAEHLKHTRPEYYAQLVGEKEADADRRG